MTCIHPKEVCECRGGVCYVTLTFPPRLSLEALSLYHHFLWQVFCLALLVVHSAFFGAGGAVDCIATSDQRGGGYNPTLPSVSSLTPSGGKVALVESEM